MFLRLKNEKGAAAVEFALVLPVLVILAFGIIYFGPIYNNYIAITHAARDGARLLAVESFKDDSDHSDLSDYIIDNLPAYSKDPKIWGHLNNINVTINQPNLNEIGAESSVKVSGEFVLNIPFLFSNKSILISNEVFMRQEQ